jgi:type I restriction enzyme M protein
MLLKGEGADGIDGADHIVGGAEWSTLAHDAFPAQELANPPYGKSWKKDLDETLFEDHNLFRDRVDAALEQIDLKLGAAEKILKAVSWRVETAPPVIAKVHKPGKAKADPLRGQFEATEAGKPAIVEYETDSDLRDTEQVPLLEDGGIEAFICREVLPYTPDAWIKEDATKIGYEVSFTRHFYKPQPLRTLEEISADILAIEKEAEGLLAGIIGAGQ